MKKKSLTKLIAVVVITSIIGTMTGCSSGGSSDTSKNETLTLNVVSNGSNFAGPQIGYFAKYIKDKFNIKLNIIAPQQQGGDAKWATLMSSGNMGDIIIAGYDSKYQQMVKSGLLLDLNQNNLLKNDGKYIEQNYSKALVKNQDQNKLYGITGNHIYGIAGSVSSMPATAPSAGTDLTYGPYIRYDLYKQAGSPTLKTMDDYLPLLKKMQQLAPKSDSGKPTYAFSMWPDWDGDTILPGTQFSGMEGWSQNGYTLYSGTEDKYQDVLDPNGYYINTLKFYNKAYQMGLVDPDSISQKYDQAASKMKDGQVLFSWFSFFENEYNTPERLNAGKGFEDVPYAKENISVAGAANYGNNNFIAIGSKTKDPERVMQFINWLYTPEGVMVADFGPQGLAWDVKDKKPFLTDYGKKVIESNADVPLPAKFGTGSWRDSDSMAFDTVDRNSDNPDFNGEPYLWQLWKSTLSEAPNALDKEWRTDMGVQDSADYYIKNKMINVQPVTLFTPKQADGNVEQEENQIKTIVDADSWKLIYAKDDADFNSILNDMTTKAKGLGYDDVVKFYEAQDQQIFKARAEVMNGATK
jgi:putative aldouronate transport system substrate-binding protein